MSTTALALPEELNIQSEVRDLEMRTVEILTRAKEIQIHDRATYLEGMEIGKAAKEGEAFAEQVHRPVITYWHERHKAACDDLNRLKKPFTEAKQLMSRKTAEYETAEEARRREEERRLQEIARKREEERQLAEAIALEEAGAPELADEVMDSPVIAPAVIVPSYVPRVSGTAKQTTWHAEVINLMDLIKAVAAGQAPIHYLSANVPELNASARRLKSAMNLPGVRAVEEKGTRFGGGR